MAIDYNLYAESVRKPFQKLCRLRFLNPDGTTAFAIDNGAYNKRKQAFISDGNISVNLQNGQRRTADIMLSNVDREFDYAVNKTWFGQEIALDEGLILLDGTEYYIQQGVFLIDTPSESVQPNNRTMRYNLVDKWANLDGTLYGNLEGTYQVDYNTNIFEPIEALLKEDKGNGQPVDNATPIFTNYYNDKYQELMDGTMFPLVNSPYTLTVDGDQTIADVILGLATMVNGWVGYDSSGRLRLDPSQDDINDATKPIQWTFSLAETTLLGLTYDIKNTAVYNDYIVIGEQLEDGTQPCARVQNIDPASDTNVNLIGRKTYRESAAGFGTKTQCIDLAKWRLKRSTVLTKAVSISSSQLFHIQENSLVQVIRTDKENNPVELHLVQGFSRPLASNGAMTLSVVSTVDFPEFTVVEINDPPTETIGD